MFAARPFARRASQHFSPVGVQARHAAAGIPALVSYFKNPGMYVPFSRFILKSDEYDRYNMYRTIKLGDTNKLKQLLRDKPVTQEEKETYLEATRSIKDQPYSIPNFMIGWWYLKGAWWLAEYNWAAWKLIYTMDFNGWATLPMLYGVSSVPFIVGLTYYGADTIFDEFKSPYYDYDRMIRILNKSLTVEELAAKDESDNESDNELDGGNPADDISIVEMP